MDRFTIKWGAKFLSSLLKLNPELKKAKALKEKGIWREYNRSLINSFTAGSILLLIWQE